MQCAVKVEQIDIWNDREWVRSDSVRGGRTTPSRSVALIASAKELFEVLWEVLPSAREIPWSETSRGDPVLDSANTDLEDLRHIAVRVHRLKWQVLNGQDAIQEGILRLR